MLGVLIPFGIALILTAIFSYQKLLWLSVILTPLSLPLDKLYYGLPFDMSIPTEPILVGILFLFLFSIARGNRVDKEIVKHPVSKVIYFYLGWIAFTSITSTIPIVSIKYLLVQIWFIVVFYFLISFLFKKQENINKFILMYSIAFIPVIIYSIYRHLGYGLWDDQAAHFVMTPFFNDHTSYGAVLAMFIPFLAGFLFAKWIPSKYKFWILVLLGFFLTAEMLSYSRAAWLSLIIGIGVWVLMRLKIKFKTMFITMVSVILIGFVFQEQILLKLEQNSTDSSANLMDHITSMTNISTDASNLERINRWQCAIAMFKERPVFGWGPGTYAMSYAPYQLTSQRTIISTNSGDGGTAHSEYLLSLSESGLIGMLILLTLIGIVLYTGIKGYTQTNDKRIKTLLMSSVIGLITYYVHAFLNNFLDTDKAAIPFWGFTAIIVSLDVFIKSQKKTPTEDQLEG